MREGLVSNIQQKYFVVIVFLCSLTALNRPLNCLVTIDYFVMSMLLFYTACAKFSLVDLIVAQLKSVTIDTNFKLSYSEIFRGADC